MDESNIKSDGKFRYIEQGEGHTIILLHGLFGALSNFQGIFDQFSNRYKVVIPMLPLYELNIAKTNVKTLAEWVKEFVDHRGYNNFTLLGNSLGGHVSLVFTKMWPEMVHSMVLTGSSGLYENAMGGSFPRREDREYIRKKAALTFYDPKHATDELVEELIGLISDKGKLIRILAIAKSAIRHNMREDIVNMDLPVCLIWGKNDTITPPEVADEFHEKLPDSELFWLDECGHAPMMEHPEKFNDLLDSWLTKKFS
jgi:pimeloyl-ACP methyl ester carboxylesterase